MAVETKLKIRRDYCLDKPTARQVKSYFHHFRKSLLIVLSLSRFGFVPSPLLLLLAYSCIVYFSSLFFSATFFFSSPLFYLHLSRIKYSGSAINFTRKGFKNKLSGQSRCLNFAFSLVGKVNDNETNVVWI